MEVGRGEVEEEENVWRRAWSSNSYKRNKTQKVRALTLDDGFDSLKFYACFLCSLMTCTLPHLSLKPSRLSHVHI